MARKGCVGEVEGKTSKRIYMEVPIRRERKRERKGKGWNHHRSEGNDTGKGGTGRATKRNTREVDNAERERLEHCDSLQ